MEENEELNKRRKRFLQTGIAIVCILGGLMGSISLIIAGLFILPAVSDRLQKKLNYSNSLKWGIFAILFIFAVFTTENSEPIGYNSINTNTTNNIISNTTSSEDIKNEVDNNTTEAANVVENVTGKVNNDINNTENNSSVENKVSQNNVQVETSTQNTKNATEQVVQTKQTSNQESQEDKEQTIEKNKKTSSKTKSPQTIEEPVQETSQTVYITNTGEKYHNAGCRYLSKSQISTSLDDAIARGYTPCKVCH